MKLGFLGTGGISEAIIRGLMRTGHADLSILVSRRNEVRSSRLADEFSEIQIADDVQRIVDESAIVVVAVLPNQVGDLLSKLVFRSDQIVASLAAGIEIRELKGLVSPCSTVHRLIPLPPIEFGIGPVPIYPPSLELKTLFDNLGSVIELADERQFDTLSASSSVMAIYFEWVAVLARWIEKRGVNSESAAIYATSLMQALSALAANANSRQLQELSQECLTSGGLNEQVLRECQELNWFNTIEERLNRIEDRLASFE